MSQPAGEPVDVAVVGAGVGGLYSAWSLRTRPAAQSPVLAGHDPPRVVLFEMGERLGGRLWSVAPPQAPHLRAELGGMRFLGSQQLVSGLIEHLGIESRPFPIDDDNSLVYLRGARRRLSQLSDPAVELPFELTDAERGHTPTELIGAAILAHFPQALELSRDDWADAKRTREAMGRPLYDLSLRHLLEATLSPAATELAALGEGYEVFLRDYSAADVLQVLCALASQDFRTPVAGYSELPRRLAAGFQEAGGELRTGHRLLTLERSERDGEALVRCVFDVGGDLADVSARHVILALPGPALSLLDQSCFLFDSRETRADLTAVAPVPASKLFLAYDEPWFAQLGSAAGHLATDLPLRQAMYFGIEGERGGADAGDGHCLLMASYNESFSTWYWADAFDSAAGVFEGGAGAPEGLQAPSAMVASAQEQLREAYGIDLPEPCWAAYRDWAQTPFGGGWSLWRLGARSFEVMPRVRRPVPDAHVYICGDTYSDMQGWVEGALSTAEHVLRDHLGLPAPSDWLAPGAQLGA